MIVTIDGPAGAGKSTVAKMLANRLGFQFLDTGAMYRAVTWAAIENKMDLQNESDIAQLAADTKIEFENRNVFVNRRDVTDEIRSPEVTKLVSDIADNRSVRKHLVAIQQKTANQGNYVCEGRDQGTVAFPDADCKIFLTASSAERAKRRYEQLASEGKKVEFDSILRDQERRDHRDKNRKVGRLVKAEDAIEINTDGMSLDEVVTQIEKIVRAKLANH